MINTEEDDSQPVNHLSFTTLAGLQETGALPITADTGQEVTYTLDKLLDHPRALNHSFQVSSPVG